MSRKSGNRFSDEDMRKLNIQSAISTRRARTAGTTITARISTVAMMKAALSGLLTNTEGSPPDISIERRRFSSIIGPST
jgi:hypothetical protein